MHKRLLQISQGWIFLGCVACCWFVEAAASRDDVCAVEILHPANGQLIFSEWQDILIASVECTMEFSVAIYIDDSLASRLISWPGSVILPRLQDGQHDVAISLQDASLDVIVESVISLTYSERPSLLALFDFPLGFPPSLSADLNHISSALSASILQTDLELQVIWTCPDWEIDWISELLANAGIKFKIIFDPSLTYIADNALVALSQNDERNRKPEKLAAYLLRFRARGLRIGVLHMSDEDYTANTYFYPWVHYVIRNHWSSAVAELPHVLAIPLGYKKGFKIAKSNTSTERDYSWSFVGQALNKPTRQTMLAAASKVAGGFYKLIEYWNDARGLNTSEYKAVLQRTKVSLCPRGFVHPESFRLSETLETGGVPLIEDDAYFDHLFGPDHPLPRLLAPPGCARPNTTLASPLVDHASGCFDAYKESLVFGLRDLIRHAHAPPLHTTEAHTSSPLFRASVEAATKATQSILMNHQDSGDADESKHVVGSTRACGHHDLRCMADKASLIDHDDDLLRSKIHEARDTAMSLFAQRRDQESDNNVELCGRGGSSGLASLENTACAAHHTPTQELFEQQVMQQYDMPPTAIRVGNYPDNACESQYNAAAFPPEFCCNGDPNNNSRSMDCVGGLCTHASDVNADGVCERYDGSILTSIFDQIQVINLNSSHVDRIRWERISAQLRKYGISANRYPGVNGAELGSAEMQSLLNQGILSPWHDSLAFDGKRSVIGCALVHLEIMQQLATSDAAWALVFEDDAYLPPHFPVIFQDFWSYLPPFEDIDLIYLGLGSNGKEPLQWLNSRVFRPSQTVGTHAYAITRHGAERLWSALRPLHQSIDSQIHETLLSALNIFAFASPDGPLGMNVYRPYTRSPTLGFFPYSFVLEEPDFFPKGSSYHGIVSVDPSLPSTIPKEMSHALAGLPACFFLEPLEGDVVDSKKITFRIVTHNFEMWDTDESEPANLEKGYLGLSINGKEVVRCARRVCTVIVSEAHPGEAVASVSLFRPWGARVGSSATIRFEVLSIQEGA